MTLVSCARSGLRHTLLVVKKVLLLDDHGLLRQGLRASMAGADCGPIEWVEAGSLAEARGLLRQENGLNLILLDLNLPDSHGLGALIELKAVARDVPVWVISSSEDPLIVIQALELGAAGFIRKSEPPERTATKFPARCRTGTYRCVCRRCRPTSWNSCAASTVATSRCSSWCSMGAATRILPTRQGSRSEQ